MVMMKRWKRNRKFLIPVTHEPGKQPGFLQGSKQKKSMLQRAKEAK